MGDTRFKILLMGLGFGPLERVGVLVIGDDEIIDGLSQLPCRGEAATLEGGAFKSLAELEQAIYDYLAKHNQNPVPFVWTATAKAILEKAARAKQTLETVRAGTKC